jgi:hypothetical protein
LPRVLIDGQSFASQGTPADKQGPFMDAVNRRIHALDEAMSLDQPWRALTH